MVAKLVFSAVKSAKPLVKSLCTKPIAYNAKKIAGNLTGFRKELYNVKQFSRLDKTSTLSLTSLEKKFNGSAFDFYETAWMRYRDSLTYSKLLHTKSTSGWRLQTQA